MGLVMSKMGEKRRHCRLRRKPRVVLAHDPSRRAFTTNISQSGIAIASDYVTTPGTEIRGEIILPEARAVFRSNVRWARKARGKAVLGGTNSMGLEFVAPPGPAYQQFLDSLVCDTSGEKTPMPVPEAKGSEMAKPSASNETSSAQPPTPAPSPQEPEQQRASEQHDGEQREREGRSTAPALPAYRELVSATKDELPTTATHAAQPASSDGNGETTSAAQRTSSVEHGETTSAPRRESPNGHDTAEPITPEPTKPYAHKQSAQARSGPTSTGPAVDWTEQAKGKTAQHTIVVGSSDRAPLPDNPVGVTFCRLLRWMDEATQRCLDPLLPREQRSAVIGSSVTLSSSMPVEAGTTLTARATIVQVASGGRTISFQVHIAAGERELAKGMIARMVFSPDLG
jgi:predicted thioesterase